MAAVALEAAVLWLAGAIAIAKTERQLARLDRWLLLLGVLTLVDQTPAYLEMQRGVGTDAAAFEQGAARLLLQGHDPYGANLTSALTAFHTQSPFLTYTTNGGFVSSFGYPALPILVGAAFVELPGAGQAVAISDVFVLILAMVAVFRLLPEGSRGVAVILFVGLPGLSKFATSGGTETLAMAAMVPVAAGWTGTGASGALTRADRLRAGCFGLALATNQLAWFMAPFLFSGIYLLRSGPLGARQARRVTLRYGWIAAAVFAAVNAPFFVWGPVAWLHGVLAPLTQHAIPFGQGLVSLTTSLRLGGGTMDAYDYAAGFLYLALLIIYLFRFRTLARACFLLPVVALFVPDRSLSGYWLTPIAVIVVSVLTADERLIARAAQLRLPARWPVPGWARQAPVAALFLPAVICLGVALAAPQPLTLRILSALHRRHMGKVQEVWVLAHNRSDQALEPHFAVNVIGHTVLWRTTDGPAVLGPSRSAVYRLVAPSGFATPVINSPFVLEAFTPSPQTISSTGQIRVSWMSSKIAAAPQRPALGVRGG
jgi:hypothetical protein